MRRVTLLQTSVAVRCLDVLRCAFLRCRCADSNSQASVWGTESSLALRVALYKDDASISASQTRRLLMKCRLPVTELSLRQLGLNAALTNCLPPPGRPASSRGPARTPAPAQGPRLVRPGKKNIKKAAEWKTWPWRLRLMLRLHRH